MKNVFIINKNFPLYRKGIWDKLLLNDEIKFYFCFSKKSYNNIKAVEIYNNKYSERHFKIDNVFFLGWILWQKGVLKILTKKANAVTFLGEMSIISTWIVSLLLRIKKVKVIFWGHGLYGKDSGFKKIIRILFLKIANHNLVYEKYAKALMVKNGFKNSKISVVYNSINYYEQLNLFNNLEKNNSEKIFNDDAPVLLFIGRLTKEKKIDQLIETTIILNKKSNYNLIIIGDGEMRKSLEVKAKNLIDINRCIFYGECYDEIKISKLLYNSDLTISPGNVGLTAIHSLSFGTPVCSHSNLDTQMPEVESIIDGVNGFLFIENNISSMVKGISSWFEEHEDINKRKIREVIDKNYNPENQENIILKAIR